ncbi:M23 family metallopeptidase [Winogradskya humida]|uniref:Peptidase M23 n=1 Tax=Winogradskya humida TaxID=113566 RepID=A0ABQ3ZSJ3_9ACTN|nr:M23 family metallopeptidase [Actinoplanes humidus]GIE21509.1 peptidase M23 [Actinoplanes humidus]
MTLLWSLLLVFAWPIAPPSVTRPFAPPAQPWLAGHRGVDLAAVPATPVHSAGAGTVVFAGVIAGRGVVSITHADGLRTTYEPLTLGSVHVGDQVVAGQEIGTLSSGHPGCPAAACLHWGLRRGAVYLNPLSLFGVRLLY